MVGIVYCLSRVGLKPSTEGRVKTGHFEELVLAIYLAIGGKIWRINSKWLLHMQL